MKKIQFILLTLVTSILVSCGTTSTVPVTGRKHRLSVSDEYVLSLSTQEYAKFMKSAKTSTNATNTALVKIGGSYKTLTATVYDENSEDITSNYSSFSWSFALGDGTDATDIVTTLEIPGSVNKIKVKFLGDESYLGQQLVATCSADDLTDQQSFDILFM